MTTPITIVGNLTKDPELRFTPSGAAVCNITVAVGERIKNQATNEWEDGDSTFYEVAVWNGTAENVAESLERGMRVIVSGGLKGRKWEGKDGAKGTSLDITVGNDGAVGPDLKWATAKVTRATKSGGNGGNGGGQPQGGYQNGQQNGQQGGQPAYAGGGQASAPVDPWGPPGGAAPADEPPF